MPSLLEVQREVSRFLLGGPKESAARWVLRDRIEPAQRAQIYRNHLRITLREALATTFPVTARLVGPDYFAVAARRFVEMHPPRGPVLAEYGDGFPAFLDVAPNAPAYLGDVARLEWAINASFHAPGAPVLAPSTLAGIGAAALTQLRLHPHPATHVLASRYPIHRIWQINRPGAGEETVDLDQGGVSLLVWRRDGDVSWRVLAPAEHRFAAMLIAGARLGAAAEAAVTVDPRFDLATALAALLREPIFTDLRDKGELS